MSWSQIGAILAIVVVLSTVRFGQATAGVNGEDGHCDVLFLGEDGPTVLRFTMRIEGKAHREMLQEYMDGLFTRFDADQNGLLDHKERTAFVAITDILSVVTRAPQLVPWELPADENAWSKARFTEYVTANLGRSITVQAQNAARVAGSGDANQIVFAALDANGDKRLSPKELASPQRILRRDWDEDDLISQTEIFPENPNVMRRAPNQANPTLVPATDVLVLDGMATPAALVRQVITKYDRPSFDKNSQTDSGDLMLSAKEINVPADRLKAYDQDQNGSLDILELRHYWENPISLWRIEVNVGVETSLKFIAGPTSGQQANAGASRFHRNLIVLGPSVRSWPQNLDEFVRGQFLQLDRDKNEYLERREVAGLEKQMPFVVFDRDHDMRVYLPEFKEVITQQMALARTRIAINLRGIPHGLFETIDVNADQRISTAEVSQLAQLIPTMDLDQDGAISEVELPNTWMLTVETPLSLTSIPGAYSVRPTNPSTTPVLIPDVPRWFSYMDRNRDRSVTRREFLGAIADFDRLDADSNGSLSAEEAAQAKF